MSVAFNFRDTIPFIILGQAPISEKDNAQQCSRTDPLVVHRNTSLRGESMCAYLNICGHGDVPFSMQGNIMQCLIATLTWVIFITHISLNRLFACWAHVDKIIHLGSKPCFLLLKGGITLPMAPENTHWALDPVKPCSFYIFTIAFRAEIFHILLSTHFSWSWRFTKIVLVGSSFFKQHLLAMSKFLVGLLLFHNTES